MATVLPMKLERPWDRYKLVRTVPSDQGGAPAGGRRLPADA